MDLESFVWFYNILQKCSRTHMGRQLSLLIFYFKRLVLSSNDFGSSKLVNSSQVRKQNKASNTTKEPVHLLQNWPKKLY